MYGIAIQTAAQALALVGFVQVGSAQVAPPAAPQPAPAQQNGGSAPPPGGLVLPADYIIGPEDVLAVQFWRDDQLTGEYVVRPDGVITLPLLNEVQAAGLTPEALRESLEEKATRYIEDPVVTVGVKAINSRKVHITGMVGKPGVYPLTGPTTVLQLIALSGGLHEFAQSKKIIIVRIENGRQVAYKFNYKDVRQGKSLQQNIQLKPGDVVVVP